MMRRQGLDLDDVAAFVLAADLRSFTRAAEALGTTQSAISLRIKRLEGRLARRLFERTPRLVRLSADGASFLAPARRLVAAHRETLEAFAIETRRLAIGMSDHIIGADLPVLLKRMRDAEPGLVMKLRIGASRDVLADYDKGLLDAAIVLDHESGRRPAEIVFTETFGWMAAPDFDHPAGQPLPLAVLSASCDIRGTMTTILSDAKIAWVEVFVGGGMMTVGAAVAAGLAIAALGRRAAPAGTIDVGPRLGLPALPPRDVVLCANLSDQLARRSLRALTAAIRARST